MARVSAVIGSHTTAAGGREAYGILAAMRPTLATLIAVAPRGAVQVSRSALTLASGHRRGRYRTFVPCWLDWYLRPSIEPRWPRTFVIHILVSLERRSS